MHGPSIRWVAIAPLLGVAGWAAAACAPQPRPVDVTALAQVAQTALAVTHNPLTGRPSLVRGRIPISVLGLPLSDTTSEVCYRFMRQYATLFGTDSAGGDFRYVGSRVDTLGLRHMQMRQIHQGVEVYAATVSLHLAPDGMIEAVSSNVLPAVRVPTTQPTIGEDSARAMAASQLVHGAPVSSRLVVYPGRKRRSAATLAWIVEVLGFRRDTAGAPDSLPARYDYVIDAGRGTVIDRLDRLYTARNRRTHDAGGGTALPGTLRRSEGQPPAGDIDVDAGHDHVGATYDYFAATHARDSYDDAGATLIATVHYSVNYQNAFWNGAQMVFGDGFAVEDVTAHELTHAVTERTADLEYRWQSGALNESFSDVFGAMVDREDWLMGEDLPIGAIRDLANPEAFDQPGHTRDWVRTCGDNEGVHINSGIPNKAFVNVAASIGKDDAERIFYRALTVYLHPQATMEDARAAALQSAEDLFGTSSAQAQAVGTGFAAVGLDGSFQPPANNCTPFPRPGLSLAGLLALAALLGLAVALAVRRARAWA